MRHKKTVSGIDQRVNSWTHELDVATGGIATQVLDKDRFAGSIHQHHSYGMEFCKVNASGLAMVRGKSEVDNYCGQHLFFIYQTNGSSVVEQGQHDTTLTSGDMVLVDSARPFKIEYHESAQQYCFHLPRGESLHKWRYTRLKLAEKVSAKSNLAKLVSPLLRETAKIGATTPVQAPTDYLLNATLLLLEPLFTTKGDVANQHLSLYLQRATAFIDQNLRDISPQEVANNLRISQRHMQRLFKSLGTSVSKLILEKRICACANDLVDLRNSNVDLTTIAFYWGFKDASYFSRVFKAYYGVTPSQYRTNGLKKATENL